MPNSLSAKKRLRQNVVLRARNRSIKSSVKTQLRKVHEAVAAGDATTATSEFRIAVKRLDKAAARRVIHPKAAARLKSRLNAKIKAIAQAA